MTPRNKCIVCGNTADMASMKICSYRCALSVLPLNTDNEFYKEYKKRPRYILGKDGSIFSLTKAKFITISKRASIDYTRIAWLDEGKLYSTTLHRAMWETFVGEIGKGLQINHIDGNKANSALSNLEVVTPSENSRHAVRTGLVKVGSARRHSKLKEEDIKFVLENEGLYSLAEFAAALGVERSTIQDIRKGRSWAHLSGINKDAAKKGKCINSNGLTEKQQELLDLITDEISARGCAPSQLEMAKRLGISVSSLNDRLAQLKVRGLIEIQRHARNGVRLNSKSLSEHGSPWV